MNRFNRPRPVLLAALLFTSPVLRAAYLPPAHEAAAQQLISHLQLHEQFLEQRDRYVAFMRDRVPNQALLTHISDQLKLTNVLAHMTGFVAAQFSEAELAEINTYLDTSVGRREYELALALVKERRSATPGSVDNNARIAAFKQSPSPQDRLAAEAFRTSPTGQKYWAQLPAIDKKLTAVFTQRCDEILKKLAASATKPDAAKTPARKAP